MSEERALYLTKTAPPKGPTTDFDPVGFIVMLYPGEAHALPAPMNLVIAEDLPTEGVLLIDDTVTLFPTRLGAEQAVQRTREFRKQRYGDNRRENEYVVKPVAVPPSVVNTGL